jgi:hypothetical protein
LALLAFCAGGIAHILPDGATAIWMGLIAIGAVVVCLRETFHGFLS